MQAPSEYCGNKGSLTQSKGGLDFTQMMAYQTFSPDFYPSGSYGQKRQEMMGGSLVGGLQRIENQNN